MPSDRGEAQEDAGSRVGPLGTPSPWCNVCGRDSIPGSYLCPECWRLMHRLETRRDADGKPRHVDRMARLNALRAQWDPLIEAFRCFYSDIPLVPEPGTRRSATWEHRTPRDESSVVLVADLVNKMKSDMTDVEFRRLVRGLAARFAGGVFDEDDFPPEKHRPGTFPPEPGPS